MASKAHVHGVPQDKPELLEEIIAYNWEKRGFKASPLHNNKQKGGTTAAERKIKKLKARVEELKSGKPEPAQDGGDRNEERDDTPETGTKKKGTGAGRQF